METFLTFFQHLFACCPGRAAPVRYGRDEHLSGGRNDIFETWLRLPPPEDRVEVAASWDDADAMGYLEGRSLGRWSRRCWTVSSKTTWTGESRRSSWRAAAPPPASAGPSVHFAEFSSALWTALMGEDPFAPRETGTARLRALRALGAPGVF